MSAAEFVDDNVTVVGFDDDAGTKVVATNAACGGAASGPCVSVHSGVATEVGCYVGVGDYSCDDCGSDINE